MGGLNHTLNVGSQSLQASRQGVDTAGHNIANAHTEGFQAAVNLDRYISMRKAIIGNGVSKKYHSRYDKFIERQLNQANKSMESNARYEAMKPLKKSLVRHCIPRSDELDAFLVVFKI